MSDHIDIVDVGPRDGLQSQPKLLETQTKVEFITRLADAGLRRMETVSFVNPKRVPQMADAEAVMAALPQREGVRYIGLVLNRRGLERALATGVNEINCVVAATDSFATRNQGASMEECMAATAEIAEGARAARLPVSVTVSVAFGCPFEGEVPRDRIARICGRLADMGVDEIAVADTIGAAGPSDVAALVPVVRAVSGETRLRCHFHDTRNTGVANAYAAVMGGVRVLDASCGGVGGCPFAPNATGNVATEDILYMLGRMGFETGINITGIMETARWLGGKLDREMPAMVTRAGLFPRSESRS